MTRKKYMYFGLNKPLQPHNSQGNTKKNKITIFHRLDKQIILNDTQYHFN